MLVFFAKGTRSGSVCRAVHAGLGFVLSVILPLSHSPLCSGFLLVSPVVFGIFRRFYCAPFVAPRTFARSRGYALVPRHL